VSDSPASALAPPCEIEAAKASDLGGELKRMALGIAYDGRSWQGWQKQTHGLTVQDSLERALQAFVGGPVETVCAGRTDAGVHGLNQVIHLDTFVTRSPESWVRGTNTHLPDSISVQWAQSVPADFHARFSATARAYTYVILNTRVQQVGYFSLSMSRPCNRQRIVSSVSMTSVALDRRNAKLNLLSELFMDWTLLSMAHVSWSNFEPMLFCTTWYEI
jgi:tRNA U38,U39,U40 pseudouridine synthase TruA